MIAWGLGSYLADASSGEPSAAKWCGVHPSRCVSRVEASYFGGGCKAHLKGSAHHVQIVSCVTSAPLILQGNKFRHNVQVVNDACAALGALARGGAVRLGEGGSFRVRRSSGVGG